MNQQHSHRNSRTQTLETIERLIMLALEPVSPKQQLLAGRIAHASWLKQCSDAMVEEALVGAFDSERSDSQEKAHQIRLQQLFKQSERLATLEAKLFDQFVKLQQSEARLGLGPKIGDAKTQDILQTKESEPALDSSEMVIVPESSQSVHTSVDLISDQQAPKPGVQVNLKDLNDRLRISAANDGHPEMPSISPTVPFAAYMRLPGRPQKQT